MSKGVLIYALNNEQVDYVKIAYYAAKQAKKFLNVPVAIVTDSADWLYQQFPDHKSVFDMVIKIVHHTTVEPWRSNNTYGVGSLVHYNGTIWRKTKEGDEVINVKNKFYKELLNETLFEKIYQGIDIDKWYPKLPYLAGQHVWHEGTLYRCHTDYDEQEEFSTDKYDVLLENVLDNYEDALLGDKVLYNRVLWLKTKNEEINIDFDENDFERIYEGIEIDKWYPDLPYLKGQHVWYKDTLYKCHTDYYEQTEFSFNKYDVLLNDVSEDYIKSKPGSKILYNRVLWLKLKPTELPAIEFDESYFERVYEGIEVDKWYPNLPYLKGQHVWHEGVLYRCEVGYTEQDTFSKEKYITLIDNVCEFDPKKLIKQGNIILYNRVLWLSKINLNQKDIDYVEYNIKDLDPVYKGIDIDKWYPKLPYLAGQHVWYKDILYRCHTDYDEQEEFSVDKYDVVLENVKDLSIIEKFNIGDILLHERTLWMSTVNYDGTLNQERIRDDIWDDTKERHLIFDSSVQYRRYFDGSLSFKRLKFKNDIRIKSFELSPFDETLVIDCDYFINNNTLKYCWEQSHDFLIFKEAVDLSGYRYDPRLVTISDKSIDFYWATVFFFRKNKNTETFFNFLGHVQDNWNYYRQIYQIEHSLYRNDYAFSIGIHIMNGFQKGSWAHNLPGKLYYTIDKDLILQYKDSEMKFLLEKEKYKGEYTLIKTNGLNIHVMNKFSLIRVLDEIHNVEYSE